MDTFELRKYLQVILPHQHSYVCAINQLKYVYDRELFVIVNTDIKTKAGVHWFAICKKKNQKFIDIFDSFGVNLNRYNKGLMNFIKRNGGKVRFNKLQYQTDYSN